MFRFARELILPLFLARQITVAELARKAATSHQAAWRAVNGEPVSAIVIGKIADALGVDAMKFLSAPAGTIKRSVY